MPITKLLRAVFGLGRSESDSAESTTVTVEHDPESTDDEADEGEAEQGEAEPDAETTAEAGVESGAETDVDAESESIDESEPGEVDESGAETADAGGETGGTTEAADTSAGAEEGADEPVDTVSGIGPSYAETLGEAGVETVGDLLAADPDDLADRTDISAKRISRWQDTAEDA